MSVPKLLFLLDAPTYMYGNKPRYKIMYGNRTALLLCVLWHKSLTALELPHFSYRQFLQYWQ